jgi:HD-GYP domain-containing protein (c-di-GMP phosphodiesterase class II)
MGGLSGNDISLHPVPLYDVNGTPNNDSIVAHAVLSDVTVNIPDAYHAEGFDFSGTKSFDENLGYRSKSFLTVPMKNHEEEIIGVLQLINSLDPETGELIAFDDSKQRLAESLASQAAMALTRNQLVEDMRGLFESFIKLIATAIDDKSPYTGGHCRRVPELTMAIADAVAACERGPLKDFTMSENDRYELKIAGWLHDCGKVTTPEWVMDKATKLQTIFDRIELLETRFELIKRDAEIVKLRSILDGKDAADAEQVYHDAVRELEADLDFLRISNVGGEFMMDADLERIQRIADRTWIAPDGKRQQLLTEDEVKNLMIRKGTLTNEERQIINHHIVATIKMLESLPYPKHLERVPEFAGGHHERMDGKGYPRGLTRDQMSVQARVMGVADIFEALTARDRPYKKPMTLSTALTILGKMSLEGHVDPDIYVIFIHSDIWRSYARQNLDDEQCDEVDITMLPGYQAL